MSSPRILRLERSDEAHGVLLLHVLHTGPAPLDLTLTATEGESPYTAIVKHSQVKSLRFKNYQGTDEEWTKIVSLVLGQCAPTDAQTWSSGIEVSTSIIGSDDENKEAVITVRKRVQDITQKLGSIILKQNDEQAIELFEWSSIAAARTDALETQLTSVTDRCRVAEDTVHKLSEQVNQLLQAKDQHENQLVSHFVQLLNEKKLKIRNQQRLLASATVDPAKVAEIQATTRQLDRPGSKQSSTKRPAQDMGNADEEMDEDLERMDVDQEKVETPLNGHTTDDEDRSTPQPLEEEGITTDDDDDSSNGAAESQKKSPGSRQALERPAAPKETPPQRELPFARRGPQRTTAKPELADNETGGETDDDEL